jgi:sugar phosphate permease
MAVAVLTRGQIEGDGGPAQRERWLRIIPIALLMYTISFINRTNISLALPAISRDLHLNAGEAGQVAGIFFWGYLLLQIPGSYIAERWSAKWLIAIMLAAWGLCAIGCGLARDWQELVVMRFLLGLAEGSVYPATLVLLSHWFPRGERARANGFWNLCLPMAVIFSSPLSGLLLDHWNWRVMLIASGVVPFVWLVLWVLFVDDSPRTARWISPAERDYLERVLGGEKQSAAAERRSSYLQTLLQPQVLLMVAIYFCFIFGSIGMVFWLPTVLAKAGSSSNLVVSALYVVPFIVGAIAMVANALHSDRWRERRVHAAIPLLGGGAFLLVAIASYGLSPLLAYIFLCLSGVGLFGPLGPFWSIPSETLPKDVAGPAMGLINAVGSLGGYFGPLAVGTLEKRSGSFGPAFAMLAVALLLGGVLAFLLHSARSPMPQGAGVT